MEEIKNVNIEEIEEVEETEMATESEGFMSKVKGGFKKHGKKIALGAVALAGLGIAFCLGKKSGDEEDEESESEFEDYDVVEIEFTESEEVE